MSLRISSGMVKKREYSSTMLAVVTGVKHSHDRLHLSPLRSIPLDTGRFEGNRTRAERA